MRPNPRPAAAYETGPTTRALRVLAVLGCVVGVAWALLAWPSLPETVPTHVDATGTPDAWGPRWTLLPLLGVWALLQAALTWLSRRPRVFNYPGPVTESNAQALYREGERMMVWVSVGLCTVFAGVVALAYGVDAGAVVVVGLMGLVVATLTGLIRTSLADSR